MDEITIEELERFAARLEEVVRKAIDDLRAWIKDQS